MEHDKTKKIGGSNLRGIHHLKSWPRFFVQSFNGTKPFEIRRADRDFQTGDRVVLHEWDPERGKIREPVGYTGRDASGTILCVVRASDLTVFDYHRPRRGRRGVGAGIHVSRDFLRVNPLGKNFVVLGIAWDRETGIADKALLDLVKS